MSRIDIRGPLGGYDQPPCVGHSWKHAMRIWPPRLGIVDPDGYYVDHVIVSGSEHLVLTAALYLFISRLARYEEGIFHMIKKMVPRPFVENIPFGYFRNTNFKSVTLKGISSMGSNCFQWSYLETLDLGRQIKCIPPFCMEGCALLRKVVMGGQVQILGENCFQETSNLEELDFPKSLTHIKTRCFQNSAIQIVDLRKCTNLVSIGEAAFLGCRNLQKVYFPGSQISIGHNAFSGCKNLKSDSVFYENETSVNIKDTSFPW